MAFVNVEEKELLHSLIDFVMEKQDTASCLGNEIIDDDLNDITLFPKKGESLSNLYQNICEKIIPCCSDFHNSSFMGFPDSGNSMAGMMGAICSDLLQQNLINATFCSPIGTRIEMAVIKWFRKLIGYEVARDDSVENIGGIVTTGGTLSNTIAMLLARIHKLPKSYVNGVTNPDNFAVVVPQGIDHYSITSALLWTGCGKQVIEVPTANYRYDLNALREILEKNKEKIMCVVAYAGDSRTMTIEDLEAVYNIVKSVDERIWLHLDACNGFCFSFSEKLKYKLKGINLWDSISMDAHKMMMIPYTASILLVRNQESMTSIRSKSDLIMNDGMSLGEITPFLGSKSWMSFKIWCVMKKYGVEGLGKVMERRYELAKYLQKKLLSSPDFKILNEVDGFSVVFLYCPDRFHLNKGGMNCLNILIYKKMLEERKFYLHQFPLIDQCLIVSDRETVYPLRFFSGNELLTEEKIDEMIEYVIKIGEEIYEKGIY